MTDQANTSIAVKLSGSDWLKLLGVAIVHGIVALVWAVRMESRVSNVELDQGRLTKAVEKISGNSETLIRIDQRTSDFDRRLDRIEQNFSAK